MKTKRGVWRIVIIMTALILSLSVVSVYADTGIIDIEALEALYGTDKSNSKVQYSEGLASFYLSYDMYGTYCSLGEVDLSQYDTMTIAYGCDTSCALTDGEQNYYFALTTNGPVQDEEGKLLDTANVIGTVDVKTPFMSWGADELEISIDSDYKGEVFLTAYVIYEQHNVIISDIYFTSQGDPTEVPTEAPTETPATETPSITEMQQATVAPTMKTNDANSDKTDDSFPVIPIIIVVVAIAIIFTVVAIIITKKKK